MADHHPGGNRPAGQAPGSLGRRDLMKLGAGMVTSAIAGVTAAGQSAPAAGRPVPTPGTAPDPTVQRVRVGPGYRTAANRLGHNGPMDDATRTIVRFVKEFDASRLTPAVVRAINRTMIDSVASIVAGFEEEPVRIAARSAQQVKPNGLASTVFGYGISTTPELAAFANGCLVRVVDFNDNPHTSNLIPGALAVGEAMHVSGEQVMLAIAAGYEVWGLGVGESVPPAMAAGKLMGLDEDRLANALSIALTPHVALNKGVGAMSMWKSVRSAEATKCGVWAATLAREGMTGPPQPFEGRGALFAADRRAREFRLPIEARLAIERNWFKRRPAEASSQGTLTLVSEMRAWTHPDEIESIDYYMNTAGFGEIGEAPKWDPRNHDTADHSMPYILARALIDGDIYLDSFTEAKMMDPAARALMDRMTVTEVREWEGLGPARIIIRKKSGEARTWDTYGGARVLTLEQYPNLTDDELTEKFNRACAFRKMAEAQRDRAREVWGNLRSVKDIGEAIRTLERFGQPSPL